MSLLTVSSHFAQSQFAQWVRVRGLGLWDWAKWGRTLLTILQSFHIILICAALLWGNEEWFMNSDKSISMLIHGYVSNCMNASSACCSQLRQWATTLSRLGIFVMQNTNAAIAVHHAIRAGRVGGPCGHLRQGQSVHCWWRMAAVPQCRAVREKSIDRPVSGTHARRPKKHAIVYAYMNVVCPAWGMIERVPALKAEDRDMNLSPNLYTIFVTPCSTVFWLWQD